MLLSEYLSKGNSGCGTALGAFMRLAGAGGWDGVPSGLDRIVVDTNGPSGWCYGLVSGCFRLGSELGGLLFDTEPNLIIPVQPEVAVDPVARVVIEPFKFTCNVGAAVGAKGGEEVKDVGFLTAAGGATEPHNFFLVAGSRLHHMLNQEGPQTVPAPARRKAVAGDIPLRTAEGATHAVGLLGKLVEAGRVNRSATRADEVDKGSHLPAQGFILLRQLLGFERRRLRVAEPIHFLKARRGALRRVEWGQFKGSRSETRCGGRHGWN